MWPRLFRYGWLLLLLIALPACTQADPDTSDILFQDQFRPAQLTNWLLEGDAIGRSLLLNEQLVIQIDAPNTMQYATLIEPTFSDFVLEVDAQLLSGPEESSYGVLFRQDEDGRFYRFQITGTGFYVLERRSGDGSWARLTDDWPQSSAIYQGTNIINRLRVEAIGPSIAIYANGELLHQANDEALTAGMIALDAGTFGLGGVQVGFDNVVVREP